MKRIVVLWMCIIGLFFNSCKEDDDVGIRFEPLRIVDVVFPSDMYASGTYTVTVTYIRPTSCHYIEGFDYNNTSNTERTVFLIASVLSDESCQELNEELQTSFDFQPTAAGMYVFKFWTGKGANNEDLFFTIEVSVQEPARKGVRLISTSSS